jgi:hypothetical protein
VREQATKPDNEERSKILVFSKLVVCFDCGFTEFRLEQSDLRQLTVASHFLWPQAGIPSKDK